MRHSGLDELQARIKISGRNNNNHRYVDDISLMAESKEKLKSHLMKVVDESKGTGLRLNIKKQNKQTNKNTGEEIQNSLSRIYPTHTLCWHPFLFAPVT